MKPQESEYPAYYHRYIAALGDVNLAEILRTQVQVIKSLGAMMNDDDALFRYAEGKWSIKEVLGHLIDCERVFAYRAMCIARGEAQPLPGFDEDAYVALREARDATLPVPALILPSLQVNMKAGRLPEPESNGTRYFRLPIDAL